MSTLPSDHMAMKDSTTYLPILRSVLKSQIQFLVEQLSDAGEETLILSANVGDGLVDQLGSESGKLFVDVYDDFKSEFLGFCQRRKGKRKLESQQRSPVDVKRGKPEPAVMSIARTVQSIKSPQAGPKVSAARIILSQKPTTAQTKSGSPASTPGSQLIQVSTEQQADIEELDESEEEYTELEDTGFGYDELQDVETWQEDEAEDGTETPSTSQSQSAISQDQPSGSKVALLPKQKVTAQRLKRRIFRCDECGKCFSKKYQLKVHALRHGEKTFHCEKCPKSFYTITELRNHRKFMHFQGVRKPAIKFVCEYCNAVYARKENLLSHIRIKHEMILGSFVCEICDKAFNCRGGLRAHIIRHGEKEFQCTMCAKLFYTVTELNKHVQISHDQELKRRRFHCNKCNKSLMSRNSLKRHMVRHGKKTVRCVECGKMFYTITELRQHRSCMHNDGERKPSAKFVCDLCDASYRRKANLEHHIKVKHENAEKEHFCDICKKAYQSIWSLSVHKKRHGDKTVQCSKCAKLFYTVTELTQHQKHSHKEVPVTKMVHVVKEQNTPINLEKMFSKAVSCSECGKLFIRGDALELHMLSHTGEYPFTCQVCGLGYRKKRSYVIHMTKKHPEFQFDDK